MMTKVCYRCKEEKNVEEFHKNKRVLDGRAFYCKVCAKYKKEKSTEKNRLEGITELLFKICFTCKENKSIEEFGKDKSKADRHSTYCKICLKEKDKKWSKNNRKKCKKATQKWFKNNPEKKKAYGRKYYKNNKEKCKRNSKKWYNNNIERARKIRTKSTKKCRKINTLFRFKHNIRTDFCNRVSKCIGGKKQHKTAYYLEDSFQGYVDYITALFRPGMTWDNWGVMWQLDHKIPMSAFDFGEQDAQNEQQIKACWSKQNLQPLTVQENLEKHDNILHEFEYLITILKPAKLYRKE